MKQYIVDAFTDKVFSGNPAAICIMDDWISEEIMMNITKENNLSETAFAVKQGDCYRLRWFTPGGEIDLCGHATLACAFVILNYVDIGSNTVLFDTLSGELMVVKKNKIYEMDLPAYPLKSVKITDEMVEAIGERPVEAYMGRDLLCILENEKSIVNAQPNLEKAKTLEGLLLHVSAPGKDTDCVSRTFAPKCGVLEDPVCGSGHCHIVPYWSGKLEQNEISAYQASNRGGMLFCRLEGDRVILGGNAALYSIADIYL